MKHHYMQITKAKNLSMGDVFIGMDGINGVPMMKLPSIEHNPSNIPCVILSGERAGCTGYIDADESITFVSHGVSSVHTKG
jgi:hypothetical protein